eukprot:6612315-Lingulodinium_polyedra.AAC.1
MELYNTIDTIESAWKAYRKSSRARKDKDGDTAGGGKSGKKNQSNYEKDYFDFISQQFPEKFQSWAEYDSCKTCKHKLVEAGQWGFYQDYCAAHCKYGDQSIENTS